MPDALSNNELLEFCSRTSVLSKIAKNKEADTVDERDEEFLAENQAIVEKYNNKRLRNQLRAESTAFKRNRSRDEVEQRSKKSRVCKDSNAKQLLKSLASGADRW